MPSRLNVLAPICQENDVIIGVIGVQMKTSIGAKGFGEKKKFLFKSFLFQKTSYDLLTENVL